MRKFIPNILFLTLLIATLAPTNLAAQQQIGAKASAAPWIGIAIEHKEDDKKVVLIQRIFRTSPADVAGLKVGDQILRIQQRDITSLRDIKLAIRPHKVDDLVEVTYIRDKKEHKASLKLQPTPSQRQLVHKELMGKSAPDIPLHILSPKEKEDASLHQFKGKPIVLEFGATWCVPCQELKPFFNQLSRDYNGKVHVLSVSIENIQTLQMDAERRKKLFSIAKTSNQAQDQYFVQMYPLVYIIDADMNVRKLYVGNAPEKHIRQTLDALLK